MAGRDQILLLLERGTFLEGFERLYEFSKIPETFFAVKQPAGSLEVFKEKVKAAEIDFSREIERDLEQGQFSRLASAYAWISVCDSESTSLSVEIDLNPHEAFLLFPELYHDFMLVILDVRGASQLQENEYPQGEQMTQRILEIINCLRPFYGFHERDNTVYPRVEWLFEMSERQRASYRKQFRKEPWSVFNRTMIFGETLTREMGRQHLLTAPATHSLALAHIIALWGPRGLLDEGELEPHLECNFELGRQFLADYDGAVAEHLNLTLERDRY